MLVGKDAMVEKEGLKRYALGLCVIVCCVKGSEWFCSLYYTIKPCYEVILVRIAICKQKKP